DRGAVIAEVALVLEHLGHIQLRHPEWAGVDAVAAADAALLGRLLDHPVGGDQDGVGRADLGAGGHRGLAMHAHRGYGRGRPAGVDVVEVDHGLAAVRVAFAAGGHARLAADAAAGVNEQRGPHHGSAVPLPWGEVGELGSVSGAVSGRYGCSPGGMGGSGTGSTAWPRSTRQAHTLNSGILET